MGWFSLFDLIQQCLTSYNKYMTLYLKVMHCKVLSLKSLSKGMNGCMFEFLRMFTWSFEIQALDGFVHYSNPTLENALLAESVWQ